MKRKKINWCEAHESAGGEVPPPAVKRDGRGRHRWARQELCVAAGLAAPSRTMRTLREFLVMVALMLSSRPSTSDSQSLLLLLLLPFEAPQGHNSPPQPLKHRDKYVSRDASCIRGSWGKYAIKSSVELSVRRLVPSIVSWLSTKQPRGSPEGTRDCSKH